MSGYVFCTGNCFGCRRLFSYNPHLVPSIVVDGVRHEVCAICVARVNPRRIENGLEPIVPLPGAYEPLPASEL